MAPSAAPGMAMSPRACHSRNSPVTVSLVTVTPACTGPLRTLPRANHSSAAARMSPRPHLHSHIQARAGPTAGAGGSGGVAGFAGEEGGKFAAWARPPLGWAPCPGDRGRVRGGTNSSQQGHRGVTAATRFPVDLPPLPQSFPPLPEPVLPAFEKVRNHPESPCCPCPKRYKPTRTCSARPHKGTGSYLFDAAGALPFLGPYLVVKQQQSSFNMPQLARRRYGPVLSLTASLARTRGRAESLGLVPAQGTHPGHPKAQPMHTASFMVHLLLGKRKTNKPRQCPFSTVLQFPD